MSLSNMALGANFLVWVLHTLLLTQVEHLELSPPTPSTPKLKTIPPCAKSSRIVPL